MQVHFPYTRENDFEIEDIEIGQDAYCIEGTLEGGNAVPIKVTRWNTATETWEPVDGLPDGWEGVVDEAISNAAEEAWERYYERFHG